MLLVVGVGVIGAERLGLLAGTRSSAALVPVVVGSPVGVPTTAAPTLPVVVATSAGPDSPAPTTKPVKSDPFAGTVVAHWPHGDKGFGAPPAVARADFTATEVSDAYRRTIAFLHEAMLDPKVLYHGAMAPVWATLDPAFVRSWKAQLARGEVVLPNIATRFHEPGVLQSGYPVHVNGTLRTSVAKDGRLAVTFHYVAVYAVRSKPTSNPTLVGVRRDGVAEFDHVDHVHHDSVSPLWLYLSSYASDRSDCLKTWPYPSYTEAYLTDETVAATAAPLASATSSPGPTTNFALLDPRATLAPKAHQCLNDTTALP